MQTRRISDISMISAIVALILGFSASPALAQTSTCEDNGTVEVCVEWSDPVAGPVEGSNYEIEYHGGSGADVQLWTGDPEWRLWTTLVSNGDVTDFGDITLNPAVDTHNFTVRIYGDGEAGAVDVGSMVLDGSANPNWTGFSSIAGTTFISGDLGELTLVEDGSSPPLGGEVTGTLIIGTTINPSNVVGPITIPKVSASVKISGNYGDASANHDIDLGVIGGTSLFKITGNILSDSSSALAIDIESLGDDADGGTFGGFEVSGSLANALATVTIQNMEPTAALTIGTLAGRLELMNGIPSECPIPGGGCPVGSDSAGVTVSDLTGTGVIDLNGADVAGALKVFKGQNNSRIIAGGAVSGIIYPGQGSSNFFNGTLTVSSVSFISTLGDPVTPTGEVEVFQRAALNGTINVTGVNAGLVEVDGPFTGQINVGSVASTGLIETTESAAGNIVVSGTCAGVILIEDDLTGTVDIGSISGGTLTSSGRVTVEGALKAVGLGAGGKILVDGICDGPIQIGQQTDDGTLIHLVNGLDAGSIEINTTAGTFDADGDIRVGPTGVLTNIVFDGCIHIYEGAHGGGALNGTIIVRGCHDSTDDLDICIDGSDNNNVTIEQAGCTNQVDWSCPQGGCP